jgi:polyphosphate kinase
VSSHLPSAITPTNRFPLGVAGDGAARVRQRRVAERAKSLAAGLARYQPDGSIPRSLAEPSYLCDESHNPTRPLVERLRILGLMATSLDQFCVDQEWGEGEDEDWEQPSLFSDEFCAGVITLLARSSRLLRRELLPALAQERGALLREPATLDREQRAWLRSFFQAQIFPLLTPLAIDPGHPFPFISSYSLNFLVQLRGLKPGAAASAASFARIKVPRLLSRFIEVPLSEIGEDSNARSFVWSEEIVRFFLPELFPGLTVENAWLFRVLRSVPSLAQDEELFDPAPVLHNRHLLSSVVRLDVEADIPGQMLDWLAERLVAPANGVYRIDGHLALFQLTDLINLVEGSEAVRALI